MADFGDPCPSDVETDQRGRCLRPSPAAAGSFVVCTCAPIAETLLESEASGYLRGAFTVASHDRIGSMETPNGVPFPYEIGEMSQMMHKQSYCERTAPGDPKEAYESHTKCLERTVPVTAIFCLFRSPFLTN